MKNVLAIVVLAFAFVNIKAQVPQGFNYQAIARDGSGNPIAGTSIDVKIGILSDTITPVVVREELFSTVKTNAFGLFSLVIGTGTYTTGSTPLFSNIDWVSKPLYLKTQIFYQSVWKYMGTSKLQSVPYSLIAKDLGGSVSKIKVTGTETSMDSTLFEVRNKTGQIVFAVYSEGVRIYVDDGIAKGTTKGGFAIGGFGTGKGTSQPLFIVDPDSIRAYVDTSLVKSVKGGFAIGSFSKGKGMLSNFMAMTPKNYFIGEGSGSNNTTGRYNSFLGYQTGLLNTTGGNNAFMGYQSGYNNTSGTSNLFLGYQSGFNNVIGSFNSFLGYMAGYRNSTGAQNSFLGSYAGSNNSIGSQNTFVGYYAGYTNTSGNYNNFFGTYSGYSNNVGQYNTFLGPFSGYNNLSGNYNVFIGYRAGNLNVSGTSNVFIGYLTGYNNTAANNVFLGYQTGFSNTLGSTNVFLGYMAGYSNVTGNNNVFLGYRTGYSNTAGNNVFLGFESGFSNTSGTTNSFMGFQAGRSNTTGSSNVFVGNGSGFSTTYGNWNVLLGDSAGFYNTSGNSNVFIGNRCGEFSTTGVDNVFIGYRAGNLHKLNGNNVYIGARAGASDSTGTGNVFVGFHAGWNNYTGWGNTYMGDGAGGGGTSGTENVCIGRVAGWSNQTGNFNVFLGFSAGYYETGSNRLYINNNNGDKNNSLIYGEFDNKILQVNGNLNLNGNLLFPVGGNRFITFPDNLNSLFIGGNPGTTHAPYAIQFVTEGASSIGAAAMTIIGTNQNVGIGTTSPNVRLNTIVSANTEAMVLGTASGGFKVGAANNLYGLLMGVGASGNCWIQVGRTDGTATAYHLILQSAGGNVGIGTTSPAYKLQVGTAGDGTQARANAWNLLSDIRFKKEFEDLTDPLDKIFALKGFYFYWNTGSDMKRQFGLSAQDVEKILPEVVSEGTDGYLSVDYGKIVPLLIEGIKVQQKQIETYKSDNDNLKSQLQTLQEKVEQIESVLAKSGGK